MDSTRPQKSTLWLWTTLWLTSCIDAFLITAAFILLITLLQIQLPYIVFLGIGLVTYALGAWFAVQFVVKRSIVSKTRADQLAFLTISVPLVGSVLFSVIPMFTSQTTGQAVDLSAVGISLVRFMLAFGLAYFIVRSYIQANGDEAQVPQTAQV